jgi:zinc transporter ZupT
MGTLVRNWPAATQLLIVGLYVAASLVIPTAIGWWLGGKFGHPVLFPLIGLGIGTVVMVYGVYRIVLPFWREARGEKEEKRLSKEKEDKEP